MPLRVTRRTSHERSHKRKMDDESKSALYALAVSVFLALFWLDWVVRLEGLVIGALITLVLYFLIHGVRLDKLEGDSNWSGTEIGIGFAVAFLGWPPCQLVIDIIYGWVSS